MKLPLHKFSFVKATAPNLSSFRIYRFFSYIVMLVLVLRRCLLGNAVEPFPVFLLLLVFHEITSWVVWTGMRILCMKKRQHKILLFFFLNFYVIINNTKNSF